MQNEKGSGKRLISPSLLAADMAKLGEEVVRAEKGGADLIHFDVMDGCFVPNLTFGPPVLSALRSYTDLPFDAHLMVEQAADLIAPMAAAGCDMLTVHYEGDAHLHRTLGKIREASMKAGVALNPATPVTVLEPVLDCIDLVLIMAVNPGFGGQSFLPVAFEKVRRAHIMIRQSGLPIRISVDGGVSGDNAEKLFALGADILVAGTSVFGSDESADSDVKGRIASLRGCVDGKEDSGSPSNSPSNSIGGIVHPGHSRPGASVGQDGSIRLVKEQKEDSSTGQDVGHS